MADKTPAPSGKSSSSNALKTLGIATLLLILLALTTVALVQVL